MSSSSRLSVYIGKHSKEFCSALSSSKSFYWSNFELVNLAMANKGQIITALRLVDPYFGFVEHVCIPIGKSTI